MSAAADDLQLPKAIGRYHVERLLGRGGQGVVLLSRDAELDRWVALKLLKPDPGRPPGTLASEARIVSGLQHPNIVTLHDVGTWHGMDYLVLEYIEGPSLKAMIAEDGPVPFAKSVILMSQILAGVAYLHENGVVHRDLGPANILINPDGVPKVTDFGISVLQQAWDSNTETSQAGTLRYMSPEAFLEQPPGPHSDVFTLAAIFYEMLTGERLFNSQSAASIMRHVLHDAPLDMNARGFEIEPRVAQVLNKASQREVAERYANAREMKNDLDEFRLPHGRDDDGHASHSSIDFLMRRMSYRRGFSSLSQHVGELLEITADDSVAPANRLVNIIAKDVTLSQRVLSLANSAYYGRAEITALPRAVVLLGIEQMRMCIVNALLENEFESGSEALRDALCLSFHSAIVAKDLAEEFELRGKADAFTAGMFHSLGRMLTIHYFGDEFDEIQSRAARLHCDELTASRAVLGVAYHELGAGVGREWKLAAPLVGAMTPLPRGAIEAPKNDDGRLQACAAYCNALSRIVYEADSAERRDAEIAELGSKISQCAAIAETRAWEALAEAGPLTDKYLRMMAGASGRSAGLERLIRLEEVPGAA